MLLEYLHLAVVPAFHDGCIVCVDQVGVGVKCLDCGVIRLRSSNVLVHAYECEECVNGHGRTPWLSKWVVLRACHSGAPWVIRVGQVVRAAGAGGAAPEDS